MKIRSLPTVDAVVDAIGSKRLQDITRRTKQSISNWKADKFFPPTTYVAITTELKRINYSAPDKLWKDMIPPVKELRRAG